MQVSKTHIYFQPLLPLDVHEVQGSKDQALHAKVAKFAFDFFYRNCKFCSIKIAVFGVYYFSWYKIKYLKILNSLV